MPRSLLVVLCLVSPAVAQTRAVADSDRLPDGAIARVGSARFRTIKYFSDFNFSPDGKLIAGSTLGPRFAVWEVATGRELMTAQVGYGDVRFTADSKLVVVTHGGEHGLELRCYEARTGRPVCKVGDDHFKIEIPSTWPILDQQWRMGPNDTLWAKGSAEPGIRELRGFELPGGKEIARTRVPDGTTLIDWTPDGSRLFLKTGDRLALHDVKAGRVTWELQPEVLKDTAFGLTPDGTRIVTREDRRLRVHDVA